MGLLITVRYQDQPVAYEVASEESGIYRLYLDDTHDPALRKTLPNKINIRRKGMIWVSDLEDDNPLVHALVAEIDKFSNNI